MQVMNEKSTIDVSHICELAHFKLSEEEQARLQKDLEPIVAYVDKLSELDLTGVEPSPYGQPVAATLREDVVEPSLPHDAAMDIAADADRAHGEFRQPKIVE